MKLRLSDWGHLALLFVQSMCVTEFNSNYRKADSLFNDYDEWRAVSDRDRRDLFDDVIHMIAKREKVFFVSYLFLSSQF